MDILALLAKKEHEYKQVQQSIQELTIIATRLEGAIIMLREVLADATAEEPTNAETA